MFVGYPSTQLVRPTPHSGLDPGGLTDLDNLTLLCLHHTHFLQKGWTCRYAWSLPEWVPPWWIDQHQRPQLNTRIRRLHAPRQPDIGGDDPRRSVKSANRDGDGSSSRVAVVETPGARQRTLSVM